jgi:hypothetical protein
MANKCATVVVTIKGDLQEVLDDVKKEAAKHDLEIKGDTKSGTIKHKKVDVKGTYTIDEKTKKISINMSEDTIFTSCDKIEAGLRDFFKGK